MKPVLIVSLALFMSSLGLPGWAAQHDQHPGHHPAGAASGTKVKAAPGKTTVDMAKMDSETKAMRAMHDKAMMQMMMDRLPATDWFSHVLLTYRDSSGPH